MRGTQIAQTHYTIHLTFYTLLQLLLHPLVPLSNTTVSTLTASIPRSYSINPNAYTPFRLLPQSLFSTLLHSLSTSTPYSRSLDVLASLSPFSVCYLSIGLLLLLWRRIARACCVIVARLCCRLSVGLLSKRIGFNRVC